MQRQRCFMTLMRRLAIRCQQKGLGGCKRRCQAVSLHIDRVTSPGYWGREAAQSTLKARVQDDSSCWACIEEENPSHWGRIHSSGRVVERNSFRIKNNIASCCSTEVSCHAGHCCSLLTSYVSLILTAALHCPSLSAVLLGGHDSCRVLS